jgi:predicted dehydrogenase
VRARGGDAPLRVGLVGYGLAGSAFHAPFLTTTPGVRLEAIVTGSADRQGAARRDVPGARIVATADELWAMAPALDAAVIATPNRTHVPLARAALDAGLHVVVDKPLAVTAAEARALVAEARRSGRVLTVYQNRRWDGDFRTLRALLGAGALGEPLRFESRFERWRPEPKPGWRERGSAEEGGGILLDLGSHLVDQALVLFGPAATVYAEVERRREGVVVEDDVFMAITHAGGVRSHLHLSALAAQPGPRLRLLGSAGAYVKHGLDVQEEALRRGERPASDAWGVEPRERWGILGAGDDLRPIPTERGDYGAFYAALAAALRDGTAPPVSPDDAVATLEVLEAARRSAADGRVVPVRGPA